MSKCYLYLEILGTLAARRKSLFVSGNGLAEGFLNGGGPIVTQMKPLYGQ